MSPEDRSLLEKTHKLCEENNQILKSIRSNARIGLIMRVVYWVVIIGLSVGAFYFIQPYIEFLTGVGGSSSQNNTNRQGDLIETLESLLNDTY